MLCLRWVIACSSARSWASEVRVLEDALLDEALLWEVGRLCWLWVWGSEGLEVEGRSWGERKRVYSWFRF